MRRFIFKKPAKPKKPNDKGDAAAHKHGKQDDAGDHSDQSTARSVDIRNQAMENLRRARANLGDDLIEKMVAAMQAQSQNQGHQSEQGGKQGEGQKADNAPVQEDIPINREKNLQTIMTFLQGLDDGDPLSDEIKSRMQKFINDRRAGHNKPSIH